MATLINLGAIGFVIALFIWATWPLVEYFRGRRVYRGQLIPRWREEIIICDKCHYSTDFYNWFGVCGKCLGFEAERGAAKREGD